MINRNTKKDMSTDNPKEKPLQKGKKVDSSRWFDAPAPETRYSLEVRQ